MDTKNTLQSYSGPREGYKHKYSFMAEVSHMVAFLTKEEILNAASKDGFVYFQQSRIGLPKLLPMRWQISGMKSSENIISFKVDTILKRTELMPNFLSGMKRNDVIHQISYGEKWRNDYSTPTHKVTTENHFISRVLREIRNTFRVNDLVDQVEELFVGDRMFLHFQDDSQAYSITVRDSSKFIWGKSRALCNITYNTKDRQTGKRKEVSQEWILALPIRIKELMSFTVRAQRVPELCKKVWKIHMRRRADESIH